MEEYRFEREGPMRLDRFLQEKRPMLSYSKLCRLLRENKIKVNGKKQPLSLRLCKGDRVALYLPPQDKRLQVIFEDEALAVLYKPAGLPTLDREDPEKDTLEKRFRCGCIQNADGKGFLPSVCHRLDTGTEGLVLAAKTQEAESFLTQALRDRLIKKEYLCVTFGKPKEKKARLRGWLYKDAEKGRVRVLDAPRPGAKTIETWYEVQAESGRLALLRIELPTGRTHQIRAHMASIGCPVLGDGKYGDNAANRAYHFRYQALCAWRLTFAAALPAPWQRYENRVFTLPKPWYCAQVIEKILQ
ncbi:MAG: RluA family pseudouridine synthase [Oscillospiraceae bacterium]|nr:RluA family pseudouridine synthase [Oscillospiraceae bacterium]